MLRRGGRSRGYGGGSPLPPPVRRRGDSWWENGSRFQGSVFRDPLSGNCFKSRKEELQGSTSASSKKMLGDIKIVPHVSLYVNPGVYYSVKERGFTKCMKWGCNYRLVIYTDFCFIYLFFSIWLCLQLFAWQINLKRGTYCGNREGSIENTEDNVQTLRPYIRPSSGPKKCIRRNELLIFLFS